MASKKSSFLRRGVLLGTAAFAIFVILVIATYPYERAVESALSRVSRESPISVAAGQTNFVFPNDVTFYDLKLVP